MSEEQDAGLARNADGKFAPGNSGGGKRPGTRNKTTRAIEALLEGEHEELTRKAIEKAKEGDMVALRLCLDRLCPPRKDSPVSFDLPPIETAADAKAASSAVLSAVAQGEITPGEAGAVMALLMSHKMIVEATDFEARLAALESREAGK
jgi:hypothetical protein